MSGSSRNSDRRSDNAYPTQKTRRPGKEKETSLFDRVSRALNPRTYLEAPAQRQMRDANENYGGGARRRRVDEVVDEAVSGGRREAPATRRSRR